MGDGQNQDMRALIGFFEGQVTSWTNLVSESNKVTTRATEGLARVEGRLDSLEKTVEGFKTEVEAAKKAGSPEGQATLLRARAEYWRVIVGAVVGAIVTLAVVFGVAKYTQTGQALVPAPAPKAAPTPAPAPNGGSGPAAAPPPSR